MSLNSGPWSDYWSWMCKYFAHLMFIVKLSVWTYGIFFLHCVIFHPFITIKLQDIGNHRYCITNISVVGFRGPCYTIYMYIQVYTNMLTFFLAKKNCVIQQKTFWNCLLDWYCSLFLWPCPCYWGTRTMAWELFFSPLEWRFRDLTSAYFKLSKDFGHWSLCL